jgi:hypothetical protein
MRKLALATAAAAALLFSAPAFTTPALAQADVKVRINSGDGMTRKKVVIRRGDRGRHHGWRHRDSGMTKKVIIRRSGDGGSSKTIIKRKTFD